jgi:hypothetical protein
MKPWGLAVALAGFLTGIAVGAAGVWWWMPAASEAPSSPKPSRSWEATVYLPLNDNQGKPFARDRWAAAVAVLVRRFGGATLGSRRQGLWLNARQRIQMEPIRLCTISFDRPRLDEFRQAMREVGRRLGQESMYVRLEEPRIEVIASQEQKGR